MAGEIPEEPEDGGESQGTHGAPLVLSEAAESFLLALNDAGRHNMPGEPATISQLARLAGLSEDDCEGVALDLRQRGLVQFSSFGAGKSLQNSASFTTAGREAMHDLGAVPSLGPVSEFAKPLDDLKRAVLNAVVRQELRTGGSASRSRVRHEVRRNIVPKPDPDTVTRAIDGLVGSHLALLHDKEPSYQVTLRGLLASQWGSNAVAVLDGVWVLVGQLIGKDDRRYPWSALRRATSLPAKALNLAHLATTLAALGGRRFEAAGDQWWTVPPDPDVLLEASASALDHVRKLVSSADAGATVKAPEMSAGASSTMTQPQQLGGGPAVPTPQAYPKTNTEHPGGAGLSRPEGSPTGSGGSGVGGHWTSIIIAIVSALASIAVAYIAAGAQVRSAVGQLVVTAGVVDCRGDMTFDQVKSGVGLPKNWRVWEKKVSFTVDGEGRPRANPPNFERQPAVLVSIKSMDTSNLRGRGVRVSVAAPSEEVTREGFVLRVYTWLDEAGESYQPQWLEVSWTAIAQPEKR